MDAEQTFLRVQSSSTLQMLTPKKRAALEYMSLFIALTLFCFLVYMHGHYVKQPACSSEFSLFVRTGANLMLIKINSAGLWLHNESEPNRVYVPDLKTVAVQWLENKSKTFEPTYLYTIEKGYFLLSENAKARHDIQSMTMNISISAGHSCFGNRWQQVLINRLVGYDTILINSLLSSPGQGYVYNYQTKEYYSLSYAQGPLEGSARLGAKLVTKCGILLVSRFLFFTTKTSASVILRETQKQMLQFTGFTYLAFFTMAAFTQHLILYFWNWFEAPAFQRFITHNQGPLQNPQHYRIIQSTVVASTFHITRLNTRDQGSPNADLTQESNPSATQSGDQDNHGEQIPGQAEPDPNPGMRNPGQVLAESSEDDNLEDEVFSDAMELG